MQDVFGGILMCQDVLSTPFGGNGVSPFREGAEGALGGNKFDLVFLSANTLVIRECRF